ncbi:GlsB/YeaQ/YmgE family stress response membrane protein [Streptomyces sp. P1-3]|uniref:GlsB/YeaQ/YmgE family stress response membrane protein n=1 Tax=Streptomyces sp. P1-3 TaxID=3421658 RepID=UPI003D367E61
MNWLWAIILGLVLGALARAILPGRQNIPIWLTVVFGILGAIVGNSVAAGIGIDETDGVDWGRHLFQLAGAVLIVAVGSPLWAAIRGRPRERT